MAQTKTTPNDEYQAALEQLERQAAALDFTGLHAQIDAQSERIQHAIESAGELFTELIKEAGKK